MIKRIKNSPFARNSLILFAGTMAANVLNYFFHLAIGRMVSVEIYGEIESLVSLMSIFSVPATTLAMVVTQLSSRAKAEDDKAKSHLLLNYFNKKIFKFGLPIFLAGLFLAPFAGEFLNIQNNLALILIWMAVFVSFFAAINQGILQGWQKFKQISGLGVFATVIKLIFGIALVKIGFGLSGAIGSFSLSILASYIASIAILKFIVTEKIPSTDGTEEKLDIGSLKDYILPVFLGNLAINILGNADMIMAKHNLDLVSAGQYGALTIISKIILFVTGVIPVVLFSMAGESHYKKGDPSAILKQAAYLMTSLCVIAIGVYFLMPKFILGILFGSKYSAGAGYLGWFAILASLYSLVTLFFQYLLSLHQTAIAKKLLILALVSAGAMFYGKNIYAILAVAILTQIVALVLGLYYVRKNRARIDNDYEETPVISGTNL